MNRARPFFVLLLSLTALLFTSAGHAGAPTRGGRALAPVRSVVPAAARGEAAQVRHAVAMARTPHAGALPAASKPAALAAGERVHNAYLLPTPGSALSKMTGRLAGKDPLVLSAAQFERSGAVLPRAAARTPAATVSARVFKDKGIIEIRLPDRTEIITLELRPNLPLDEGQLQKAIGDAHRQLFQGTRRPDVIRQTADGKLVVHAGSVKVIEPRTERLGRRPDRRLVLRTPPRRRSVWPGPARVSL